MFTTQCFIRKNTPELRKYLEILGYSKNENWFNPNENVLIVGKVPDDAFCYYTNIDDTNTNHQDCGTNEELFNAIAALRDDSDYMQLVWQPNEGWNTASVCLYRDMTTVYPKEFGWEKATVEELINHFK